MPKIAIVTDSTASIPPELVEKFNIKVVPLVLLWGEKQFLDGIDIQPREFYDRLVESDVMPTTSQATVASFMDIYRKLVCEGYEILTLVISSKLSGTLDSATQAKKAFPDAQIEIIDSLSTSLPLAILVLMAARAIETGATLQQVKQIIEVEVKKVKVFFAVDTLTYLYKGGRIGGAARFMGTALGLKPILELRDGQIEALEKVRTSKKAQSRLIELLESYADPDKPFRFVGIIAANATNVAEGLLSEVRARFKVKEIMIGNLSPVIGTHTGPGTVGIGFLPE